MNNGKKTESSLRSAELAHSTISNLSPLPCLTWSRVMRLIRCQIESEYEKERFSALAFSSWNDDGIKC